MGDSRCDTCGSECIDPDELIDDMRACEVGKHNNWRGAAGRHSLSLSPLHRPISTINPFATVYPRLRALCFRTYQVKGRNVTELCTGATNLRTLCIYHRAMWTRPDQAPTLTLEELFIRDDYDLGATQPRFDAVLALTQLKSLSMPAVLAAPGQLSNLSVLRDLHYLKLSHIGRRLDADPGDHSMAFLAAFGKLTTLSLSPHELGINDPVPLLATLGTISTLRTLTIDLAPYRGAVVPAMPTSLHQLDLDVGANRLY